MANDGQIVFEVTADGKKAIANIKDITKAIQQETGRWDDAAEKSAGNIDSSFSGMLGKLGTAFSAAKIGKALLDIGKDAVAAASDLQEVQNVVDVTFGESAGQIETWAKNAGSQFGLTETQAKRFSSTMGAMLKSSGMAGDQIVEMSTDLAGLAADMASFYNLDFDEAFAKIRSGISGETEPLKQLGINMSVANLEAFALEQGITKAFSAMDQGEQTALRYQYLMQATADAQGDFARTSDSYANSVRKLQTNVDNLKTALGTPLLNAVSGAVGAINGLIESMTPDENTKTVLDTFNEIDVDTSTKMADLQTTYDTAQAILDTITQISEETVTLGDGSTVTFGTLFEEIGKIDAAGGDIGSYIDSLGLDVDQITGKYKQWRDAQKRLTDTAPALTSAIDEQSGAIDGGTDALQNSLDEWKRYEEAKLAWSAYYAKQRALEEKKAALYTYELDAAVATNRRKRFEEEHAELAKIYADQGILGLKNQRYPFWDERNAQVREYMDLIVAETEAVKNNENQVNDFAQAEEDLASAADYLTEKYGAQEKAVEQVADATSNYLDKTADEWKDLTNAATAALGELDDYVKSVEESALESVNSIAHGLDRVDFLTYGKQIEDINKLTEKQAQYKVGSDEWKQLQSEIDKANDALINTDSIYKNLQSQADFLDTYLANLKQAREMGLSDALLAELSDGSVESAEYLNAIVNDKSGRTPEEIDALYNEVQGKKNALASELAGQQLTVDQTYQSLADKAKEAVASLDLQGEAAENSGKTVAGIATGIASHVSEVQAAVDSILDQLNRLSGYGINIDFGGFGSIDFTTSAGTTEGSARTGLAWVPHDNYIARLHEGERVLTAQENQIWNALRNGGVSGFDLEQLGGVMRDNVKPGGDVFLDGRIVGSVISDQQGKSYRQLQRSGWQR